ncbi:putative transcriptional regulator [Herbaspirillum sp. Sphag1AN]|uniref:hypothetical protein n=1 Tax=unclassified Herbaspirillum TaxID=2624150 RepID=UPI00161209CF|nr:MULTISPECIES: hypothetical protein [unclassified Herbaspirillum]MBB3211083.1 putative transcriptional regulator [Herbaspirillum sp. Sphag1AN]MBB3244712.1 putative transcriptional regulator [Herbaspirillum sp. Sphag64]
MSDDLTRDEFDAMGQVSRREHHGRPSACVARNVKRLTGIKLMEYGRDGQLSLTEKGKQTLFIYRCIETLRALAADPNASVDADVAVFLSRKGHIVERADTKAYDITQRGRESITDIDAQAQSRGNG